MMASLSVTLLLLYNRKRGTALTRFAAHVSRAAALASKLQLARFVLLLCRPHQAV